MTRWSKRYLVRLPAGATGALLAGALLVPPAPLAGTSWSDPGPARTATASVTGPYAGATASAADAARRGHAGGAHPERCEDADPCSADSPASPIPCAPAPGCAAVAYLPAGHALVNGLPTEELGAGPSSLVTPAPIALDLPTPPPRV